MTDHSDTAAGDRIVLRVRIALRAGNARPAVLETALAAAITATVDAHGGTVERLQLSVALDPRWRAEGPADRCA